VTRHDRISASLAKHIEHAESLLDLSSGNSELTVKLAEMIGATKIARVDVVPRPTSAWPELQFSEKVPPLR
jgi:hypothetical protein